MTHRRPRSVLGFALTMLVAILGLFTVTLPVVQPVQRVAPPHDAHEPTRDAPEAEPVHV